MNIHINISKTLNSKYSGGIIMSKEYEEKKEKKGVKKFVKKHKEAIIVGSVATVAIAGTAYAMYKCGKHSVEDERFDAALSIC